MDRLPGHVLGFENHSAAGQISSGCPSLPSGNPSTDGSFIAFTKSLAMSAGAIAFAAIRSAKT
jgi:hypothetical protein